MPDVELPTAHSGFRHTCDEETAPRMAEWTSGRGGVAVWGSVDFSNPGASWSTPANSVDGQPTPKPTWQATAEPLAVITNNDDIGVCVDKEVNRFHVGVRPGGGGFMLKLTAGATRKVRKAVSAAGQGAYHVFDYYSQDAVIMAPASCVSLTAWLKGKNNAEK